MTRHPVGGDATTRAVHHFLRERRPRRTGSTVYAGYVVALVLVVYLAPYGASVLGGLDDLDPVTSGRVELMVPWLVTSAALAVLGAAVHDGSWRGCLRVELAAMDWPLSGHPSWPRWAAAGVLPVLLSAVVAGASVAAVGMACWATLQAAPVSAVEVATAVVGGATIGLVACAGNVAAQVEMSARAARVLAALLRGAALACALVSVAVLDGWRPAQIGVGRQAVALYGCGGLAVVIVLAAVRALGRVRSSRLRAAAGRREGVVAALMSLDTRLALNVALDGPRVATTWRAGRPRRGWATVPWHVLTGCLRRPAATSAGLAWVAAGVVVPALWPVDGPLWQQLVVASLVVQRGASLLSENVRIQTDDVHRSSALPQPVAGVVTASCLAVAAVVAVAAASGLVAGWVVGTGTTAQSWVVAAVAPTAAVGAGITACRGTFPVELLLGADTPFGNTAPVQVALWLVRVPVTLAGTTVAVGSVVDTTGVALLAPAAGVVLLLGTVLWLRSRAADLARS